MTLHRTLLVTLAVVLAAPATNRAAQSPVIDTAAYEEMSARLAALAARFDTLETRVGDQMPESVIDLDCETGDFSHIVPAGGYLVFLVSCEGIEARGEGHDVTLRIGNPHSAAFGGLEAQLAWGRDIPDAENHAVGMSSSEPIQPGWNTLTFSIIPSTREDLGTLRFTFSLRSVLLRIN